ncbi:hypothetical protein UNDYM_1632 [Undibacterium sp. YM2]|uniref:hypothetical protein n=1 Tax=Undibacterium sp. YM2 TaxID=2058625 RepID=UPI001331F468|nr:hypothetical protein [Undibacterium sp. YM2]BBB65885.1 hypothetical protein UNDYM_1632 [Undibacterium sp. YM2]
MARTKTPEPDLAALEIAHGLLATRLSFQEAMNHPTWKVVIKTRARKHMQQREQFDLKKLQANDND